MLKDYQLKMYYKNVVEDYRQANLLSQVILKK